MEWTISNGIVVAILFVLGALMLLEVFRFIRDQLERYFTSRRDDGSPSSSRGTRGARAKDGEGRERRPRNSDREYE